MFMNLKFSFILFFIVSMTLVSCDKKIFIPQDSPQFKEGRKVPYTMLLDDASRTAWKSMNEFPPTFQIIKDVNEFIPLFSGAITNDPISSPFPPNELGNIDFDNEIGIVISRGYQRSGPHSLKINDIRENKNILTIYAELVNPERGVHTAAVDYRISLLKVKKSDIPSDTIKWELRDQQNNVLNFIN
jgi:hypothetical protein